MIEIPSALQARLASGVTTLAWCWVVTRRDGAVFGFTDHDQALDMVGVTCEPTSGFTPGALRVEANSSPARGAVFGAINSERVSESDLDNRVWDRANVELYRVDWTDPNLLVKTFTGELGAMSRNETGFEAEISGLSARLNTRIGRVFADRCDAELGDARCGVSLQTEDYSSAITVVSALNASAVLASSPSQAEAGWFQHGTLTWTAGANSGVNHRIRVDRISGDDRVLELDPSPANLPQAADTAQINVGCDKRFETCRSKFSNVLNFRGCPHMPGNDVLMRHASADDIRDGGAR